MTGIVIVDNKSVHQERVYPVGIVEYANPDTVLPERFQYRTVFFIQDDAQIQRISLLFLGIHKRFHYGFRDSRIGRYIDRLLRLLYKRNDVRNDAVLLATCATFNTAVI